jgi:O-antigen/teichoic acid export membrane protein
MTALDDEERHAVRQPSQRNALLSLLATGRDAVQAGLGVLDQGVTALGSLIPVVLLGRLAGATDLGLFSLAVSTALFAAIVSQSLFLSGYPIFRAQEQSETKSHTFYALLFGLGTQVALIPICLGVLLWMPGAVALDGTAILAATAFVVATTLRSYLRTLSLVRRDLPTILALDSLALVILSVLLVVLAMQGLVGVWNVFIALAVANAAFAVVWAGSYARHLTVRFSGAWTYLLRAAGFGRWALVGVGVGSMPYYLMPWLLSFSRGTEAVATYAAASTIVGLANHAFIGLMRGIESRTAEAFHQGGIAALRDSLRRTTRIVVPALAVIVAIVWIAADLLGQQVLPGHAQETGAVARILSLSLLVGSARVLAGNALWAMSLPRATMPADVLRGVVSIGAGVLGAHLAGAVGCAVGVLLGDALSSVMVVWRYTAETRQRVAKP